MPDGTRPHRDQPEACPGAACFELLGRKWTAYLVWALIERPRRFGELRNLTPGLTDRMLTVRLRSLEAAGIVTRHQYAEIPVRVEYALTDRGRDLAPVIVEMERWGRRWAGPPGRRGVVVRATAAAGRSTG